MGGVGKAGSSLLRIPPGRSDEPTGPRFFRGCSFDLGTWLGRSLLFAVFVDLN